jgi:hypothetical protein
VATQVWTHVNFVMNGQWKLKQQAFLREQQIERRIWALSSEGTTSSRQNKMKEDTGNA